MNALGDIFRTPGNPLACAWQVLRDLGSFIWLLKYMVKARQPLVPPNNPVGGWYEGGEEKRRE
jgi:hypothetical protein